jgi:hypothetical protein
VEDGTEARNTASGSHPTHISSLLFPLSCSSFTFVRPPAGPDDASASPALDPEPPSSSLAPPPSVASSSAPVPSPGIELDESADLDSIAPNPISPLHDGLLTTPRHDAGAPSPSSLSPPALPSEAPPADSQGKVEAETAATPAFAWPPIFATFFAVALTAGAFLAARFRVPSRSASTSASSSASSSLPPSAASVTRVDVHAPTSVVVNLAVNTINSSPLCPVAAVPERSKDVAAAPSTKSVAAIASRFGGAVPSSTPALKAPVRSGKKAEAVGHLSSAMTSGAASVLAAVADGKAAARTSASSPLVATAPPPHDEPVAAQPAKDRLSKDASAQINDDVDADAGEPEDVDEDEDGCVALDHAFPSALSSLASPVVSTAAAAATGLVLTPRGDDGFVISGNRLWRHGGAKAAKKQAATPVRASSSSSSLAVSFPSSPLDPSRPCTPVKDDGSGSDEGSGPAKGPRNLARSLDLELGRARPASDILRKRTSRARLNAGPPPLASPAAPREEPQPSPPVVSKPCTPPLPVVAPVKAPEAAPLEAAVAPALSVAPGPCPPPTPTPTPSPPADAGTDAAHRLKRFGEMLRVGVPRPAVEVKIRMEGLDCTPAELDAALAAARAGAGGGGGGGGGAAPLALPPVQPPTAALGLPPPLDPPAPAPTTTSVPIVRAPSTALDASLAADLAALFSAKPAAPSSSPAPPMQSPSSAAQAAPATSRKSRVSLLDAKRATNAGIALAKFRGIPFSAVAEALLTLSPTPSSCPPGKSLTPSQCQLLVDVMPSPAEVSTVARWAEKNPNNISSLAEFESFVLAVSRVPRLAERAASLAFVAALPTRIAEVQERTRALKDVAAQLKAGGRLKRLLSSARTVLLSSGPGTAGADAASLASGPGLVLALPTLRTARVPGSAYKDARATLLHFLAALVERTDADAAAFAASKDVPALAVAQRSECGALAGESSAMAASLRSLLSLAAGGDAEKTALAAKAAVDAAVQEVQVAVAGFNDALGVFGEGGVGGGSGGKGVADVDAVLRALADFASAFPKARVEMASRG